MKIKAYYGEWFEADIKQAVSLYNALSDIARRKYFDKHFRGISRERIEAERKRN